MEAGGEVRILCHVPSQLEESTGMIIILLIAFTLSLGNKGHGKFA